ncbi:MAG: carboxymuconolactone decarboxylase family protein [Hyphomicrobiaceae bacterium]
MARVPYLTKDDLAPEHKDLLDRDINLYKALINSPGGFKAFRGLGTYIRFGSTLEPRMRELAILQVGWLARSPYEWSHHVKIGYDFGVTPDDIRALIDDTDGKANNLDPMAKLVLKGAREMTNNFRMSDETFSALQKALSAEHLNDLVITIGFYSAVVRILATLEIDVEDSYQKYLDQFPLPAK